MNSDYYINLHFNQAIPQKTGYAFKIGDKGCTFHFHCIDLDPTGMFPHIVFNHPNNTCVEGIPTGSGRDYAYTIQGNEFGVCGKTVVDLKFYDDDNDATQRISTASFMIEIIADTYTPLEETSSSYADSLERAREELDAAIVDIQGAEHDLEEAEGDLDNMSEQFADTLQDYIDAFGNTAPINPRGEYDPTEPYVPRDAVEYTAGGKTLTYINKSACTGIAPTDPDYGADHWQIMIDVSVGGSFSALSDVSVDPQTLADGQVPVYDATGQVWANKTILEDSLTSTATNKALTAAKGKALQDNKQPKELETAITIAGTSETTVEGALGALNTAKQGTELTTPLTIDGTEKSTVETALGGLNDYGDTLKGEISHKNFFLNPFFTVNQRGFTSGTASVYNNKITVDGWLEGYGSGYDTGVITKTVNGMHMAPSPKDLRLMQEPDDPTIFNGKTWTFTVYYAKGNSTTFEYLSGTITNFDSTVGGQFFKSSDNGYITASYIAAYGKFIILADAECTVKAAKLEPGTVSTLRNDIEPNYTMESLKCQRRFYRITVPTYTLITNMYCESATTASATIKLPVEMKSNPTFSYTGTIKLYDGSNTKSISNLSIKIVQKDLVIIQATSSGLTQGQMLQLISSNQESTLDFEA